MKSLFCLFAVLLAFGCNEPPAAPGLNFASVYFIANVNYHHPVDTVRIYTDRSYLVTGVLTPQGALPYTYHQGLSLNYSFDDVMGELYIYMDCSKWNGSACACDSLFRSDGIALRASVVW